MMLKKLMLMLAVCGFAQPAQASATRDVATGLALAACVVGSAAFAGGLCTAVAGQLGYDIQGHDFWYRLRNGAFKVTVAGGVLAVVAARGLDKLAVMKTI